MSYRVFPIVAAIFLLYLIQPAPCCAETPEADSRGLNKWQELSRKIGDHWHCRYDRDVDLQVEFKLNKVCDAYDIRLTRGYDNPFAIRAALHAIICAMPFEQVSAGTPGSVAKLQCTISGSSKSPKVKVEKLEEINVAPNEVKDELSKIPPYRPYSREMLADYQESRLQRLCTLLYRYSDSLDIKREIVEIGTCNGLGCTKAHHWISLARCRPCQIRIMRNAKPETEDACKAVIAAYQQALVMERSNITRFELEDAYVRLAAIDVMNRSKADPLLLGVAALLIADMEAARGELDEAVSEDSDRAKGIIAELERSVDQSELRPLSLSKERIPARGSKGWKPVLYWLPADTELLIQAVPSSVHSQKRDEVTLISPMLTKRPPGRFISDEELANNRIFEGCQMAFVLHGARTFAFNGGIGLGNGQCADVIVFGDRSVGVARSAIERLRSRSKFKQVIEGVEVLSFDSPPFSFARGAGTAGSQYLCSPLDGVLIASNELGYLREVLYRMRNPSELRAFPEDLPEWKLVDDKADLLVFRHSEFRVVPGLVAYRFGRKWTIKQLSNDPEMLEDLRDTWKHMINYKQPGLESRSTFNATIQDSLLTVETVVEGNSLMGIQLAISMGYHVSL
ncbi:MAG: hypothetical protein KC777_25220 [Cyanobacteria bacterium HKST-UBA02]|nr:hypothetical protein [Cyanobacteria bacterium HKST-UBA02]